MDNVCRMQELECTEDLIDEVLDVLCLQLLFRLDDSIQISLHQLAHEIYLTKYVATNI